MIEPLCIQRWDGVGDWRTDPTFAMCRALVGGADLASFAGGPFDIPAVVAAIERGTFDGAVLDDLSWVNFPDGERAREAVGLLRTGDGKGLSGLSKADLCKEAAAANLPDRSQMTRDDFREGADLRPAVNPCLPHGAARRGRRERRRSLRLKLLRRCAHGRRHPGRRSGRCPARRDRPRGGPDEGGSRPLTGAGTTQGS